jgi:HAD superfamily hydrolase (TIGR01458 family)
MKNKLPLLIDFDGVIRIGDKPAPDAEEFLNFLVDKKIPVFFLSNSTLRTSEDIKNFLADKNLPSNFPAMTTVDATLNYIESRFSRVSVYCVDSIKTLFNKYIDDKNPEAIVIGDLGTQWNFQILNEIFLKVCKGAHLIAMHKNKFWLPDGKNIRLDAGAFVSAIEYASDKKATLIGKPSPIYFRTALGIMEFPDNSNFYMIGDDIEADINAAQNVGGKGILIYTGKTKYPLPEHHKQKPDYEAFNLKGIIDILNEIYV